jgi:hypothetical protein
MQTFVIFSVFIFSILAFIDTSLQALDLKRFYPTIVSNLIFYISTTLGILYVSKILWILIVLDFIHASNKESWSKYPLYRAFDNIICIAGFSYQFIIVSKYIVDLL